MRLHSQFLPRRRKKSENIGNTTVILTFYTRHLQEGQFALELYIGTEDNPNYIEPAPMEYTQSDLPISPSGKIIDYLLNPAHALRDLLPEVDDPYLFELERLVTTMKNVN
ncbi:hypothetical protein DPMN_098319 [Dreissena polymorpha]|uniref:glutathione-specific gamma-glutamylcyclotransferase n=1 Tax=Dreissena polymorpha TaxID=45954 RepID=A0A9D4R762_DREPO|nr:hypothetical protein DPMN_098319 [Dreissena polymorpha]